MNNTVLSATAFLSELHCYLLTLEYNFGLSKLSPVSLSICVSYCDSPVNLVKERLVAWFLQSRMDYLLTSYFHLSLTPLNALWKLAFSSSPSTLVIIIIIIILLLCPSRRLAKYCFQFSACLSQHDYDKTVTHVDWLIFNKTRIKRTCKKLQWSQ